VSVFDVAVLDTNFFIALESAGIGSLIPKLQKYLDTMKTTGITSAHVPKTDVPGKFRQLRTKIPKSVKLVNVDRNDPVWRDIASTAKNQRMIAYEKDPADIDICFIALKNLHKGKRVAVVSDDVGVARVINENPSFQGIEHLSNGAFLSIVSTTMSPERKARLDRGIKIVFLQSWKYRNRSRNYIDINLLVDDLTDTAKFVRLAAESVKNEVATTSTDDYTPKMDEEPVSLSADDLFKAFNVIHSHRDMNNIVAVEQELWKLHKLTSIIIAEAKNPEEKIILSQMIYAELFEIHSWALDYRIKKNTLIEALLHSEALKNVCGFVQTSPEIVENISSLQGLICLLLGKFNTALNIFTQIPIEGQIGPTQLLGLTVSFIASQKEDKAMTLLKDYDQALDGLSTSVYKYGNDCFIRGQQKLAIKILEFMFLHYYDDNKEILTQYPRRLFILSRIAPSILKKETQEKLAKILGNNAKDESSKSIPRSWLALKGNNISGDEESSKLFQDVFFVLEIIEKYEEKKLFVMAWGAASLWLFKFDIGMYPALSEAVSFKIKRAKISSFDKRSSKDPQNIRGSIIIDDAVLQVDILIPWI
jgi:hypothetical protein